MLGAVVLLVGLVLLLWLGFFRFVLAMLVCRSVFVLVFVCLFGRHSGLVGRDGDNVRMTVERLPVQTMDVNRIVARLEILWHRPIVHSAALLARLVALVVIVVPGNLAGDAVGLETLATLVRRKLDVDLAVDRIEPAKRAGEQEGCQLPSATYVYDCCVHSTHLMCSVEPGRIRT